MAWLQKEAPKPPPDVMEAIDVVCKRQRTEPPDHAHKSAAEMQTMVDYCTASCWAAAPKRPSPRDARDVFEWPKFLKDGLENNLYNIDFTEKFKVNTSHKMRLTTDYSGLGAAEIAFVKLPQTMNPKAVISVLRAGDKKASMRKALMGHKGRSKARCVFGDMMARMPSRLFNALQDLKARTLRVQQRLCEEGGSLAEISEGLGQSFIRAAIDLVMNYAADHKDFLNDRTMAWCYVHKKQCKIFHGAGMQDEIDEVLEIHLAGMSCYDWSKMGMQAKWLGESTWPFLQWCLERLIQDEDLILVECFPDFPTMCLTWFSASATICDG